MKHLDEGTIHAWLDGALSATEAHDAESHVKSCAECSAKVAEARGFIAGVSRILTSLDDVPAVTPKRAPSTAPAVRQWRAAPWVTGIAATLMLAIGITTYSRQDKSVAFQSVAKVDSNAPAYQRAAEVAPAVTAPVQAPRVADAVARRDQALGEQSRRVRMTAQPESPSRSAAGAGAGGVQDLASGVASDTAQVKKAIANAAPAPAFIPAPTTAAAAFRDATANDALAKVVNALDLAGCYPIEQPQQRARGLEAVAEVAGKVAASTRQRSAAAPSAARVAEPVQMPSAPAMVLLDTTRGALGYVALVAGTRTPVGSWNRVDGDSVRVDLLVRGLYTIPATKRTNCP
jgi:anti-sigma factor RsiW